VAQYALIALFDPRRGDLFHQILASLDVNVIVTRDGEQARALLASREPPILLVTETSLPLVDGFTLIEELRLVAPREQTPAVLVATSDDLRSISESIRDRLGISDILPLPLSPEQARAAVRRALEPLGAGAMPAAPPGKNGTRHGLAQVGLSDSLVQKLVGRTAQTFRVPVAFLFWDDGVHRWFEAHLQVEPTEVGGSGQVDWAFIDQTLQSGEPLVVPDSTRHPLFENQALVRQGLVRGYAAAPLVDASGKVLGALGLVDFRPLSLGARELDGLVALARHVGQNLERWTPGSETEATADPGNPLAGLARLALVDPLTGLVNRLGGERTIAREIARARRLHSPLSFAMFDVDHFKQVNDRHGHQAGDRVLRAIANKVRITLRRSDVAVRWGGEEFLAVLPETNLRGGRVSAERVREAVAGADVKIDGQTRITVSCGVAELESGEAVKGAIARADANLYEAKAKGRNTVV
jgi:diguanylate cyclase (GGDEF)-like protein